MEMKTLGNSGLRISPMRLGAWAIGREVVIAAKFGFEVDEDAKCVVSQPPEKILSNLEFECERSLHNLGFSPERIAGLVEDRLKVREVLTGGFLNPLR